MRKQRELIDSILNNKVEKKEVVKANKSPNEHLYVEKYKDDQPEASKIIANLGGNTQIAIALGIAKEAVSYWRKKGIPPIRLMQLEMMFGKDAMYGE